MLLTKEDVRAAGGIVHSDGNVFFTNLDQLNAVILAKLAIAELPEPLQRDDTEHGVDYFTADQLRQAYAQGAAAQLAKEPIALMWQHDETGRVGFLEAWGPIDMFKESNPRLRIVASLYTRRQAND